MTLTEYGTTTRSDPFARRPPVPARWSSSLPPQGASERPRELARMAPAAVRAKWLIAFLLMGSFVLSAAFSQQRISKLRVADLKASMASVQGSSPEQVHLAILDDGENDTVSLTISWVTSQPTHVATVRFGENPSMLVNEVSAVEQPQQYSFCGYTSPFFHHVHLPRTLVPGRTYYYKCGSQEGGWSLVRWFRMPLKAGSRMPLAFALIGDLGQTATSMQTLHHLQQFPDLAAVIHAGDLSYADSDQPRWDRWGKLVEPYAARYPWMVAAGNHEEEGPCDPSTDRFIAYQKRFRMPYRSTDALQMGNLYYGFRYGMVHFVVLTPYVASDASSKQYRWLEQELQRVDRSVTPWLCVVMHGPWYNSNTAHQGPEPHQQMKANMEELLHRFHVDIVVAGHVHAYERSFPVYKEQVRNDGSVYIVIGDGGNREGLAKDYMQPQPVWSAYRRAAYGFEIFRVLNATHAVVEWYKDHADGQATLHDSGWIHSTAYRMTAAELSTL